MNHHPLFRANHVTLQWLSVAILALLAFLPSGRASVAQSGTPVVRAVRNLSVDPYGRVVDMAFDQDLALTAPWDRFHFDINIVQPLARDAGAFLGDLTGDGVLDLVMAGFTGDRLFFPGVAGSPTHFGEGTLLKQTTTDPSTDPFTDYNQSGYWLSGDIGDLDGDGQKEIVIGRYVFSNVGTSSEPKLQDTYTLTTSSGGWDPAASLGDLDGDGKLDVVLTYNYSGGTWVMWNHSAPGVFSFTQQLLYTWPSNSAIDNHLAVGDLNGDGLLDLVGPAGIYFNTGTVLSPTFTFTNPSPWNKTGGPSWLASSDQPGHVFLKDGDGDSLLDAYVSNLSSTLWQVLFYENVGTAGSHHLQYVGPVVAASTPLNVAYRGDTTPSFSPNRPFVATADIDQNGLSDVLLSTEGGSSFGSPTILWSFPSVTGTLSRTLAYQDLYTFPTLDRVDYRCGAGLFGSTDALCKPPNLFSAWLDLTGDGLADALRTDQFMDVYELYRQARTGSWPFTLGPDSAITSTPSLSQTTGWGVTMVDVDLDGHLDMVTGSKDGRLLYYRNTATSGPATFADPVPLADSTDTPIDVGDQSWPTTIDLDGDGDLDFLVASYTGVIRKVLCVTPGSVQGYSLGALLGTPEQDPVEVTHVTGGGTIVPSLTTIDVDSDGLPDVIMGDARGRGWLLRNIGTSGAASFSLRPLTVSRTAAAYLEILDSRHIRLSFALPTVAGQTVLAYHSISTLGSPISGIVTITEMAYGVTLVPSTAAQSGNPGALVTYTLALTNTGDASDTYTMTVSNTAFTTAVTPSSVGPVTAGASQNVTVTVQLPANIGGLRDIAVVTATSQGDPTKSASSTLTTTVACNQGPSNSPSSAAYDLDHVAADWGVYCEGAPTWAKGNVALPSLDGEALRLSLTGGDPYSGAHFYRTLLPDSIAAVFSMTVPFYISPTTTCNNDQGIPSIVQAIEFTMNKWQNAKRYEFALQWQNVGPGASQWRYWDPHQAERWVTLTPPITQCLQGGRWYTLTLEGEILDDQVHYNRFTVDQQSHDLNITVTPASTPEEPDRLAIAVQLDGNYAESPYNVFVDKVSFVRSALRGVALTPSAATQSGNPGTSVTYTLALTNTGNAQDTFIMTVGSTAFTTTATPATVGPLNSGVTRTVTVTVQIPANAAGGASNVAIVTAASLGDATKSASSTLTTTANTVRGITLTPPTAGRSGDPGTTVTYTLRLTNGGNMSDSYTLTVGNTAFTTTVMPMSVGPLEMHVDQDITVTVQIPLSAARGITDTALITATSLSDVSEWATVTLTTEVSPYKVFLPLLLKNP